MLRASADSGGCRLSGSSQRVTGVGRSYAIAAFLLLAPLVAATTAAIGFTAGITITRLHLPLAVLVAALATWAISHSEGLRRREVGIAVALGIGILIAATAAADLAWDFSYDGQAYHQSAIRQLAAGWNPVAHALTPSETTHGLWLNHYVRAVELGAATITRASGSLEAGKAFGMGLVVAAALLSASALRSAGFAPRLSAVAAILVAANPIVLSQLPTFYVDGELALVFACALALAAMAFHGYARSAPFLFAAALAFLANVKFTATVYAVLLLAGYVVAVLARRMVSVRQRLRVPILLATTWTLVLGWQPLLTNLVDHGHPFYPVAGEGRVDGRSGQTPFFRHEDPARRLLESTFAQSDAARALPVPKWPFVVRTTEITAMEVPDVRVGGFGPLFALALVLVALGTVALPWSRSGAGTRAALLVAGLVVTTVIINPGAWWARFVPQLWIAVVLAGAAVASSAGAARPIGRAAVAALLANAAVVGTSTLRHQIATHAAAVRQMRDLAHQYAEVELPRGEMESLDVRLDRGGVRARYVAACGPALPLEGTYALYCEDGPRRTNAAAAAPVPSP